MTTSPALMRLDPDPRAPQQARQFVARALADDPAMAEVAQLLVSELVTNAVVHAASVVDVEVEVDASGATVRVRDADTGPLVLRAQVRDAELDEGGRGVLLVDQLADAWGTEHRGGRKTVWFRLSAAPGAEPPAVVASPESGLFSPARTAERRLRTLLLRPTLQRTLSFEQQLGELLARIIDAVGGAGAAVVIAPATKPVVTRGQVSGLTTCAIDLVVDDRRMGAMTVHVDRELDDEDDAFLHIAAERVALLASEHGVLQAEQARAAELDYLSEATELLAGSLSVSLSLTLVTQIVVPRLAEWCAAYVVDDRGSARRLTANHRKEERTDAVHELLEVDRE